MLTGQHHPREVIANAMVLYSLLTLIHGGVVHGDPKQMKLLEQNKYIFMPTVNVDGLALIEKDYLETGKFDQKRKNMDFKHLGQGCS